MLTKGVADVGELKGNVNALASRVDRMDGDIRDLRKEMNARFVQIDERFVQMEERFTERFIQMEERFTERFNRMEEVFGQRLGRIEDILLGRSSVGEDPGEAVRSDPGAGPPTAVRRNPVR